MGSTRLLDVLLPSRVQVPLAASTIADAAIALAQSLEHEGVLVDPDRLFERIEDARAEDILALSDRAFVLHYRTDAVNDTTLSLGITPQPLCRGLGDAEQQCARIIVLACAPAREAARHLQMVGTMARLLSRRELTSELERVRDAEELLAFPPLAQVEFKSQLIVRDIMTERPRTIGPDAPLKDAAMEMRRAGVSGLPVIDDNRRVLGMLSERELLQEVVSRYLVRGGDAPPQLPPGVRRSVRDVMTRQVLCVSPEQPLADVASLMLNKDVDRVPVVKDGLLVGFLTRGDIVRKLTGS